MTEERKLTQAGARALYSIRFFKITKEDAEIIIGYLMKLFGIAQVNIELEKPDA